MIRLERRSGVSLAFRIAVPCAAFVVALLVIAILLVASGSNPVSTYQSMVSAAFTSSGGFSATLVNATPLVLTGLCATVAFRLEIYNIGGEGQLYMGAMGATAAGLALGHMPGFVIILGMVLAGAAAGAAWALIPALLRAYLGTNEIMTSLMLNYVAGLFITYLIFDSASYWRNLSSAAGKVYPTGKTIPLAGSWPNLGVSGVNIPLGFIIGVGLALCSSWVLRRTTLGYRIRVAAGSHAAARYGGIRLSRLIVIVMVVSGLLAGLAGASEVGGVAHLLDPTGLQQAQYGYAGIVVAALAGFEPVGVIVSGLLLGAIASAGTQLAGIAFPVGLVGTMEGIVLFAVVSTAIFVNYRVRWTTKSTSAPAGAPSAEEVGPPPTAPSNTVTVPVLNREI